MYIVVRQNLRGMDIFQLNHTRLNYCRRWNNCKAHSQDSCNSREYTGRNEDPQILFGRYTAHLICCKLLLRFPYYRNYSLQESEYYPIAKVNNQKKRSSAYIYNSGSQNIHFYIPHNAGQHSWTYIDTVQILDYRLRSPNQHCYSRKLKSNQTAQ
jgi:hypothetical protein